MSPQERSGRAGAGRGNGSSISSRGGTGVPYGCRSGDSWPPSRNNADSGTNAGRRSHGRRRRRPRRSERHRSPPGRGHSSHRRTARSGWRGAGSSAYDGSGAGGRPPVTGARPTLTPVSVSGRPGYDPGVQLALRRGGPKPSGPSSGSGMERASAVRGRAPRARGVLGPHPRVGPSLAARPFRRRLAGAGLAPGIRRTKRHTRAADGPISRSWPASAYLAAATPRGSPSSPPPSSTTAPRSRRPRFALPTLKAEVSWCLGMSEPNAGSDLAGLRTRAISTRPLRGERPEGVDLGAASFRTTASVSSAPIPTPPNTPASASSSST